MAGLARSRDAAVLVGTETSDDAGVYRLSDEEAIVCTADFITPPEDDPFLFGQIAATNALSDVYAMGGRPLAALALCVFPKALHPDAAPSLLRRGRAHPRRGPGRGGRGRRRRRRRPHGARRVAALRAGGHRGGPSRSYHAQRRRPARRCE